MELKTLTIEKPEGANLILGQAHFIKTVEDLHETLVGSVPGIRFGLAFCESSGPALVRGSGTDEGLVEMAEEQALRIGAGHVFLILLGEGFFPVNVLNAVKMVPEVCRVFCATANPTQVILAETEQGRGVLGVVDGVRSREIEGPEDVAARHAFLRAVGYKQ